MAKSLRKGSCRPRQRGAVAPLVAVMLSAVAISGFCAIEIGRVYYAQRELQTLANTAAMDAVRVASGCAHGIPDVSSVNSGTMNTTVQNAVLHSISVNQPSSSSFVPLTGLTSASNAGRSINDIDTSGAANNLRYFGVVVNRPSADAVQVALTAPQPAMLTSLIPNKTPVTLQATATARQINVASWQVRTSLLNLNTANSVLGPLLGIANLNLSVASYQSLLSASLPAASVAVALGVSNPQSVGSGSLASVSLPLGTALNNLANALTATGQTAAANILSGLASQASSAYTVSPKGLFASSLTAISPVANLDAFDLLSSLAEDTRAGGNPAYVPISATIANTTHVATFLQITGPQVPGFGPPGLTSSSTPMDPQNAQNSSSAVGMLQVRMSLPTTTLLSGLLSLLPALNNPLLSVNTAYNFGMDIALPQGTAGLAALTCPSENGLAYNYQLATNIAPITVKVGTFSYSGSWPMTTPPSLTSGSLVSATLLGINVLNIAMNSTFLASAGTNTSNTLALQVQVPFANPFTAVTSPSVGTTNILTGLTSGLNADLTPTITVLGILPLGTIVGDLVTTLSPIFSSVDTNVLNPTLGALGLQLGSTYVEVDAPPPSPSGLPPVVVTERSDSNDSTY